MRRGLRLHPDDPDDPNVFRVQSPEFGMGFRAVFSRGTEDGVTETRLLIDLMSFHKRPDIRNPRRWATGVATAGAAAVALRRRRRHGA